MSIIIHNSIWLIIVAVCYFTLVLFIPFYLRGYRLTGEHVLDKLVNTFLYSNVIIILVACFLSLIGLYYRATIIASLICVAVGYRLIFKRPETLGVFPILKQYFFDFADGYHHPRIIIRILLGKPKFFLIALRKKFTNPVGLLFTLGIFGYGAYIRCYQSVVNMFYGTSDMYLHTEWIKYFMHNKPYISGIYPFGFHSIIAVISSVFQINVVTVIQMFGPIIGMLMLFSLYFLLRRTMHSSFAINIALALYIVTDLFPYWAMERQFVALPQEFGTVFLYLTAYYLFQYMKNKKKRDLINFTLSVSLTLLIHFFVTVYAFFICAAIFIAHIAYLNRKTFARIVIGILSALIIAVAPLGGGMLKGIEFNGSMGWALSYVLGSEEAQEEAAAKEATEPITILSIYNRLVEEEYFNRDNNMSLLNANWFVPYLIAACIAILAPTFKFKDRRRQWIFLGFSAYSLLMCILFILAILDIFAIMEYSRLYSYFLYSVPLVMGVPFELLYSLLNGTKKAARVTYLTLISAVGITGSLWIGINQRFMPLGRIWQSQYNGAVLAYYDIVKQFPKNQWTIVSSNSEYTLCLFEGYHYQMAEFILELNEHDTNPELYLAGENVFFYVEKRPNIYLDTHLQELGNLETLDEFDKNETFVNLQTKYGITKNTGLLSLYQNIEVNRILQAKADAWTTEYMKYFPDEMSVFYEDDEIIVYRIKQNPYALNNFSIPYTGNQQ